MISSLSGNATEHQPGLAHAPNLHMNWTLTTSLFHSFAQVTRCCQISFSVQEMDTCWSLL